MNYKQKDYYIRHKGVRCPFCHGNNLSCNSIFGDGEEATQDIKCLECGKVWTDIYTLTDVEEIQEDEEV